MSGGEAKLWTSKRSRTPSRRWTQAERHRGDAILLMQASADQNPFRSYLSLGGPRRKRRGSAGEAKRWMLPRFRTPSTRWTQATESEASTALAEATTRPVTMVVIAEGNMAPLGEAPGLPSARRVAPGGPQNNQNGFRISEPDNAYECYVTNMVANGKPIYRCIRGKSMVVGSRLYLYRSDVGAETVQPLGLILLMWASTDQKPFRSNSVGVAAR